MRNDYKKQRYCRKVALFLFVRFKWRIRWIRAACARGVPHMPAILRRSAAEKCSNTARLLVLATPRRLGLLQANIRVDFDFHDN